MLLPEAAGNWNQYTSLLSIQYSYLVSLNLLRKRTADVCSVLLLS